MLTKDDFIRHILGEAPRTKSRATKKDTGHIEGFDFADDAPDSEATEDTRFVTPLLQAGFGDGHLGQIALAGRKQSRSQDCQGPRGFVDVAGL